MINKLYLTDDVKDSFLWSCVFFSLHLYTMKNLDLENYVNSTKNIVSLGALLLGLFFFFLSLNGYQKEIRKWSHIVAIEFDECHQKITGNCENIFLLIQEEAKENGKGEPKRRFTMYFDSNKTRYVTTISQEDGRELNKHEKLFLRSKFYHFGMDKLKSSVISLDEKYFCRKDISQVPTRYAIESKPQLYFKTKFTVIA